MEMRYNLLPFDGEAYFYPAVFDAAESIDLYRQLKEKIDWKQEPIRIMGREIMQPRLTAWYGDEGKSYTYSGITMEPKPWNGEILFIKQRIEKIAGQVFSSVLLNYYRDGMDSMGWHRDNEKELGRNPVIGSVSFGAPRYFRFRHAKDKKQTIKILLTSGSFLLMKGSTQHHWHHSIPKSTAIAEGRINLTFRTILSQ